MKKYHIYGVGAALVDTEYEVADSFLKQHGIDKGVMTLVEEQRQSDLNTALANHDAKQACGGSAANTIIGAASLGSTCFYSCRVADDDLGRFYRADLAAASVDSNNTYVSGATTGKCTVMVTNDAERTMNTFLGTSAELSTDELDEQAIINSEWVYLEGYLVTSDSGRAAAVRCRELAEQHGVKTALTFSDPGMVSFFREGLTEMLGANGVDLLFCNQDEALAWTGCDNVAQALIQLQKLAKQVVITLGDQGALIFDGQATLNIDAVSATAIDSNGAGDSFAAGYLHGISQGANGQQAGDLASKIAAQVVSRFGPRLSTEQYQACLND